jgi:hypothetical protein
METLNKLNYVSSFLRINSSNIILEESIFYLNNINSKEDLCSNEVILEDEGSRLLLNFKETFNLNIIPYNNLKYFEIDYLETGFIILDKNGDYCISENQSLIKFNESVNDKFKNRCNNLVAYYKLWLYITSDKFADHHNELQQEIVLFSSVNGIFKIKYDFVPELTDELDYTNSIINLIENLNILELHQYFKNTFFTFSNGIIVSLNQIFLNANDIVAISKRAYELVSKQFNFEKFKNSLYKEKEKYFFDVREIINKIFAQAIGIPVSISATLFATYKTSDDSIVLFLILFTFMLYVFFYIRIQLIYRSDLKEIESDFKRDFEIIKSNSGLDENTINYERLKIKRKIENSIKITNWLLFSVSTLAFFLVLFIYHQIFKSEKDCLINLIISTLSIFKK